MSRVRELGVAVALDAAFGEPPARVHPVVAMGRLVDALEKRLPAPDAPSATRAGGLAWAAGASVVAAVAVALRHAPWPVRGVALWTLLSGRLLLTEVAAVETVLVDEGLDAGRRRVAWLVSRDTAELTPGQVRSAAVSSLAENTNDAVVATLWWWSIGGLPAAAVHRWTDTLDSRWGYRDATWGRRGRVAAHADDVLAAVPAVLTALLWRGRLDAPLRREARRTPSPNGGWPMAAAALSTDSRLQKPDVYALHVTGRDPDTTTVADARRQAGRVMASAVAVTALVAASRDRRAAAGGAA